MPGRRSKPTVLRLVEGNPGKRPVNKKEPKPKRVIPSCPAHLSDSAKVAWGGLCVILDKMGVLTQADGMALERLCACYAEILECDALIERDGRTYKTQIIAGKDSDGKPLFEDALIKANPAVAMRADADRRFKSYLVEFGLTPAARTKVHGDGEDDPKDPSGRFFT